MKKKTCSKCKVNKPTTEFNKRRSAKDGLNSHCKCCNRSMCKIYRDNNPEKIRQQQQNYKVKRPDIHSDNMLKYLEFKGTRRPYMDTFDIDESGNWNEVPPFNDDLVKSEPWDNI